MDIIYRCCGAELLDPLGRGSCKTATNYREDNALMLLRLVDFAILEYSEAKNQHIFGNLCPCGKSSPCGK
jgi:hypothetical protein